MVSSVLGFRSGKKQAKAQEAAYRAQAANYLRMADAYSGAARAQAATAGMALRVGKANAKQEIKLASYIQPVEDLNLQQANARRRAKIGEGRAAFAANGVLVDSGAAARWEIDEAKDAAVEKLQIMQSAEDQVYSHRSAAWQHEIQGYSNAGAAYAGAAQTAAQGYASALSAANALAGAGAVQGPSALAASLGVTGTVAGAVGSIAAANAGSSNTNSGIRTASTQGSRLSPANKVYGMGSSRVEMAPILN